MTSEAYQLQEPGDEKSRYGQVLRQSRSTGRGKAIHPEPLRLKAGTRLVACALKPRALEVPDRARAGVAAPTTVPLRISERLYPFPCDAIRRRPTIARSRSSAADAKHAIGKNHCAQTATPFHQLFRARCEGWVHPITRGTLFDSSKTDSLHLEFSTGQTIQFYLFCNYVASQNRRRSVPHAQLVANFFEYFSGEKRDLARMALK